MLTIRRYIVEDIRGVKQTSTDPKRLAIPEQPATKISYKGFVRTLHLDTCNYSSAQITN